MWPAAGFVDTKKRGIVKVSERWTDGGDFHETYGQAVQDREGGGALLQVSRPLFPFIRLVWADGGYNHERVKAATHIRVEIVSKIAGQSGFVVLPRRWVVERFFDRLIALMVGREMKDIYPPRVAHRTRLFINPKPTRA